MACCKTASYFIAAKGNRKVSVCWIGSTKAGQVLWISEIWEVEPYMLLQLYLKDLEICIYELLKPEEQYN